MGSNLETFKEQINTPNTAVEQIESKQPAQKIRKNLILSYISDYTGCGHIRNILPSTYLNAIFGKDNKMNIITSPTMIFQPDILNRTRSILFQRTMGPNSTNVILEYKKLQQKYQYKMIYDIDDFVWYGDNEGEEIPNYNFGKEGITHDVQQSSLDNMKLMDCVTVTCDFLKDYIASRGIDKEKIKVVQNTLPGFLWGNSKKPPITSKIKKPTVLWTASPTHWHDQKKLKGDMDNAWFDWIMKSVKAKRINYIQMGGLPWFFDEIKNDIKVYSWFNSLHYPSGVKSINADFSIMPLVPNYFNYSKSPIKYQEACVSGALGVGTVFSNGKPSPYDIALTKVSDQVTVDELDYLFFERLCEPDIYNATIEAQYQQVVNNSWITESVGYINMMTSIL